MPCEQSLSLDYIVPSELEASRVGILLTRSDKPVLAPKTLASSPFSLFLLSRLLIPSDASLKHSLLCIAILHAPSIYLLISHP